MTASPIELAKDEIAKLTREDPAFVYCGIGVSKANQGSIEVAFLDQATADKYQQQIGDSYKGFPVIWTTSEPFIAH